MDGVLLSNNLSKLKKLKCLDIEDYSYVDGSFND